MFVDLKQRAGLDPQGKLGFLFFDVTGEFVAEYLLGIGGSVEANVGVEEEDLVDKKLRGAQDRKLIFAQLEELGEGVVDGFFGKQIDEELLDGERGGGVDEAVDVAGVDLAVEDGELGELVGAES